MRWHIAAIVAMALPFVASFSPVLGADVTALVEKLDSAEPQQRNDAVKALGDLGPQAADAVDALADALTDDSPMVRAQAAFAIGKIGGLNERVVDKLTELLTDPDVRVRRAVIGAFERIRPDPSTAVPWMLKVLGDEDPAVVTRALLTIAEAGEDAVPAMIGALKSEKTRYWALLALSEIGPKAKKAVPALVDSLADPNPNVRMEVLMALGAIGKDAANAIPAIAKQIDDPAHGVQSAAVLALGRMGPAAKAATGRLRTAYMDGDAFLKNISIWALAKIHPERPAYREVAIERLLAELASQDPQIISAAARSLIDLKVAPEKLIPPLATLLEQENSETKGHAAHALAAIGRKAVPSLVHGLKHPEVRLRVLRIFANMGKNASEAIPAILKLTDASDAQVRREALFTVARIDPGATGILQAAIKGLDDPSKDVHYAAVYALGRMGPAAQDAIKKLQPHLNHEDENFCKVCAWAVARIDADMIGPSTGHVVGLLADALTSKQYFVRIEAAEALGVMGQKAKAALPALKKSADDPNLAVQDAVSKAIEKIEG